MPISRRTKNYSNILVCYTAKIYIVSFKLLYMFKLSQILLSPKKAVRHPFEIIFVVFFYTSISLFMSLWIFPEHASIVMIFLAVIACLYIVEGVLIVEEKKESNINSEAWLLKQHSKTLWFLFLLFFGFLITYTIWTIALPETILVNAFESQNSAYQDIITITGKVISHENFQTILSNNLRVLFLSLLFAVFFGAGAIFILAWNASIMGFVIGTLAKTIGLISLPHIFLKYFIHGIPEILSYLAAALAGSILFISIIKGDIKKGNAKRIFIDSFIIVIISIIFLIIAALIETYISPFI